jgi:hypothetical protein
MGLKFWISENDLDDIASGNESEEFTMAWQYTNLYD